jgi:hypothetical protein
MLSLSDGPKQQKRDASLQQTLSNRAVNELTADPEAPFGSLRFEKWLNEYDAIYEVYSSVLFQKVPN